ncbi:hypothetical protein BBK82_05005 [Lentzea guizhouensis]|uniref:Head-tail adaptor protein n=2 Tax=Lentzea guizhouensis TaxID=1586287 RepID=A0A1B2HXS2_9PSEU|nr:hypothetical protein BBK82_05005 [Lentzea guizhouensis]
MGLWRRTTVPDGAGGHETIWVQQGTVRVRISQPTGTESKVGDTEQGELTHQVYDEPGSPIRRGDELRDAALTLRVMRVLAPSEAIYLRADCEEQQPERG